MKYMVNLQGGTRGNRKDYRWQNGNREKCRLKNGNQNGNWQRKTRKILLAKRK